MVTPLQRMRESRQLTRVGLSHVTAARVSEIREWEEGYLVRESAHAEMMQWFPDLELWLDSHLRAHELLQTHHGSATRQELEREYGTTSLEHERDKAKLKLSAVDLLGYLSTKDSPQEKQSLVQCLSRGKKERDFIGLDKKIYEDVKYDIYRLLRLGLIQKFVNGLGHKTESFYSTRAGRSRAKLEIVVLRERAEHG